jgi:hypothetical protein
VTRAKLKILAGMMVVGLGNDVAFAGGSCQTIVTCQSGTANCQATADAQTNQDFFDTAICSAKEKFKTCAVNRRYDRGPNQGTSANLNVTYVCCLADGTAWATPSAQLAEQNCANP